MVTAGLAAWLGPGWAVTVDGLVVFAGGPGDPRVASAGGLARMRGAPEACVAAADPAAVAFEGRL
jgi:hypothetical protein